MTTDELLKLLPQNVQDNLKPSDVESIEGLYSHDDKIDIDVIEDAFLDNIKVLAQARNMKAYVNAVRFVTLREHYGNKTKAWQRTFPEKASNSPEHYHPQYASSYNKTKLVVAVSEQALVAMHIMYSGARHNAIMSLVDLTNGKAAPSYLPVMEENEDGVKVPKKDDLGNTVFRVVYQAVSPTVQAIAAKTIIETTNIPVVQEVKHEIGISQESIDANRKQVAAIDNLAEAMQKAMIAGVHVDEVQKVGQLFNADDGKLIEE